MSRIQDIGSNKDRSISLSSPESMRVKSAWVLQDTSKNWVSVASSSDGTKLVALVGNGQIYTSSDTGSTWKARDSARNWISVASSSDGTKLVAAVFNGNLYTSTDSGQTWTSRDGIRYWTAVASSSDGVKLVATENGNYASGYLYTSTDSGVTWSQNSGAGQLYFTSIASSADGVNLIAGIHGYRQIVVQHGPNEEVVQAHSNGYPLHAPLMDQLLLQQPVPIAICGFLLIVVSHGRHEILYGIGGPLHHLQTA